MFKKILLPTDGSPVSRKAVRQGVAFAKSVGAKVVGFFSPEDYRALIYSEYVPPSLMSEDQFQAQALKTAQKHLAFVEKTANAEGVHYEGFYLTRIAPWEAIIEAAKNVFSEGVADAFVAAGAIALLATILVFFIWPRGLRRHQ